MRSIIKTLFASVCFGLLAMVIACDNQDDPTAQETQLKKLVAKTWNVQSVKVDGVDHTELFQNMTLTIAKSSFTSTYGGTVWPAAGTWEFADQRGTLMNRGDNLSVTIVDVSHTELKLSLQWSETTFGPGRISSIGGLHEFTFN